MSALNSSIAYAGVDRRASKDRRGIAQRRRLMRYESIDCDRRKHFCRRQEDSFWLSQKP